MKTHVARIPALLLLCLVISSCGIPPGQRLLHIEIELDGQVAFDGIRGVPDYMPVEQMWDVLDDVRFKTTEEFGDSLSPDAQTHSLDGNVIVRIRHVDDELAIASLSSLSLDRGAADSSWLLSDGQKNRVKQAIAKE